MHPFKTKVMLILSVFSSSDVGSKWRLLYSLLHPTTKHFNRLIGDILVFPCTGVDTMADSSQLTLSRFMGSRSHPHRVLSVCMCVCVSRCLWVCVIEADSLQLRVITVGLYQFLSRSLSCQILAEFAVDVYGPFWFLVPRFLSPAFLDSNSWALLLSWTLFPEPCCLPGLRSPETRLPIASLRYPPLPSKSSTLVSLIVLLLVINSLFRNWILPSSLWHTQGGSKVKWSCQSTTT